ncbi:hypothetical protein RUM43_001329 [Polyplax serrata]|uniref:Pre-rRNA-processing protein TSR2 homolog n=1 Tax=Polyplax serrata TaxID=468196 RepID=A0AAN8XPJ8_POLSC
MEAAVFKGIVQNILNRWSGLKLSVEHQSGGRHSKEKALYLIDYINEVLFTNSKVETEDLEDLITEYMDTELQTILEDNSVQDVSKVILQLFLLFQSGKHDELQQELNKLPHCDLWLDITYSTPRKVAVNCETSSGSESETEEPNKGEMQEPMDCEWTQVSYKRR